MSWLFRASLGLLAYTYLAFPAITFLRGLLWRRPHRVEALEPSVSVVIAAHDEEVEIQDRIENLRASDYPSDRLEIIIASDGSIDGTNELVAAAGAGVRLLALPRVGKGEALMRAVKEASGEIVVFSDANSRYAPDAIRALVKHFADPSVGGVAGNQVYVPPGAAEDRASGERAYWSFDRLTKTAQSAAGSITSATGAIYAIRRSLFRPIPEGVTDDFSSTLAVVAAGHRFVFAPDAIAYETVAPSAGAEYGRKVRIMTRGLRCVLAWRQLLNPLRYGFFSVQLLTHKVLMRTMAVPLLGLLVSSLAQARRLEYAFVAALQVAAYVLGGVGLASRRSPLGQRPLLALPAYLCLVQVASLQAAWNLLARRRIVGWRPSRAGAELGSAHLAGPAATSTGRLP